MWTENTGHLRMGHCATDECSGYSVWRLEVGDVGSDYCRACKDAIQAHNDELEHEREQFEQERFEHENRAMEEHFTRHPHG